jgi:putative DNA primase/helicase
LVFSGNDRPHIANVDEAMRRRIHLIPFTQVPKKKNTELKAMLRASELPAVLAWAIDGCIAWRAEGLRPPQCVVEATEEYFRDEEVMGRWLGETCVLDDGETGASELHQCWQTWCQRNDEESMGVKAFGAALAARGFKKKRSRTGIVYAGVSLLGDYAVPALR